MTMYFVCALRFVLFKCSHRCFAEAGYGFPGWLELLPHTPNAHLIVSASSGTLVFSPLAARLFQLVTVRFCNSATLAPSFLHLCHLPRTLFGSSVSHPPSILSPSYSTCWATCLILSLPPTHSPEQPNTFLFYLSPVLISTFGLQATYNYQHIVTETSWRAVIGQSRLLWVLQVEIVETHDCSEFLNNNT